MNASGFVPIDRATRGNDQLPPDISIRPTS